MRPGLLQQMGTGGRNGAEVGRYSPSSHAGTPLQEVS